MKQITERKKQEIIDLIKSGKPPEEVARATGVSLDTILEWLKKSI